MQAYHSDQLLFGYCVVLNAALVVLKTALSFKFCGFTFLFCFILLFLFVSEAAVIFMWNSLESLSLSFVS